MMKLSVLLICLFASSGLAFVRPAAVTSSVGNKLHLSKTNEGRKAVTVMTAAAAVSKAPSKGGEATIATSTFNMAKSIIGAGVLSLPSGIAFFSSSRTALLPAGAILTTMGLLAAYTFSLIGKACAEHNASTFQEAWSKSVSPKTAWLISGGITAKCFFASLMYSIIIGDSFSSLAKTFGLPAILAQRSNVILGLTTFALFPICSLKSLNSLAPFSLLGLGGTLYTAIAMAIRYFDGSYATGGKFFAALATKPAFADSFGGLNVRAFLLLSMLSTSFIAHYNAPKFYSELKDTSLPRFNKVVGSAFIASIVTYLFIMTTGFLTFGGNSLGFVLNNYAGSDSLISIARLAVGFAILTGYPFTFSALREGVLDLANVTDKQKRDSALRPLTVGLLSLVTALALVLKDVGFVVSMSGALFGAALMFVVPAIMNISNIKRKGVKATKGEKLEVVANYGIVGLGTVMGALGATISTLRQLKRI